MHNKIQMVNENLKYKKKKKTSTVNLDREKNGKEKLVPFGTN